MESFEEKLIKVKEIVEKLNSQDVSLKDGVELYKVGIKKISDAVSELENAKLEFEKIEKELSNNDVLDT